MVGKIFDIQKFSIHDGPGIRTLVFFKGCPLRCPWCSNPESQKPIFELMHYEQRCTLCGTCAKACPHQGIDAVKGSSGIIHRIDRRTCDACGECVRACPNDALRLAGREVTVDEVISVVLQDYLFYLNSNGGVTLGGGEPTMQPEFMLALLRRCQQNSIHTAIETCGHADWTVFETAADLLDLCFYDVKMMDSRMHRNCTGVTNEKVLENLIRLLEKEVQIVVRVPVIENINDTDENLVQTLEFLREHDKKGSIQRVELLPYHKLGVSKHKALGRGGDLGGLSRPSSVFLRRAERLTRAFGFTSSIEEL